MIPFVVTGPVHPQAQYLIGHFGLVPRPTLPTGKEDYLIWQENSLYLKHSKTMIRVDFTTGATRHRHQQGGGLGQAIAKAVGLRSNFYPCILDTTAGLGQDAFVLATLGSHITMLERSPIAAALLADGLHRAKEEPLIENIIDRMVLIYTDAYTYLTTHSPQTFDVVYLDPMFPEESKSALPKKAMQAFHTLIGQDKDSNLLLAPARKIARKRIVVKRGRLHPWLNNEKPHYSLIGKSTRFDVYLPN